MSVRTLIRGALGRKGLGCRKDAEDPRDRPLSALLVGVTGDLLPVPPYAASVADPRVGAKDQGATSSCVGFAWSLALRLAYLRARVDCPDLSGLAIYFAARAEHAATNEDLGTYLRAGAQAIQRYGAPSESAWPYSALRVNKAPSFGALHSAHDRRGIRGYYRIPSGDVEAVRRAIALGHPVVGGWEISASFLDWSGSGAIGPQRGEILGGHAIALDTYEGEYFSGPGSWGTGYGLDGRHVVTADFVAEGFDLWCVALS